MDTIVWHNICRYYEALAQQMALLGQWSFEQTKNFQYCICGHNYSGLDHATNCSHTKCIIATLFIDASLCISYSCMWCAAERTSIADCRLASQPLLLWGRGWLARLCGLHLEHACKQTERHLSTAPESVVGDCNYGPTGIIRWMLHLV